MIYRVLIKKIVYPENKNFIITFMFNISLFFMKQKIEFVNICKVYVDCHLYYDTAGYPTCFVFGITIRPSYLLGLQKCVKWFLVGIYNIL